MRRRRRREFTTADVVAIVLRATDEAWKVHCERCGTWCKSPKDRQIDHVIPEAMRPLADMARRLRPADGRLLCLACHAEKTPRDLGDIAEAKRREAYALGVERPGKRKLWVLERKPKPPLAVAPGPVGMARRYR
jgi:hypothetical protein